MVHRLLKHILKPQFRPCWAAQEKSRLLRIPWWMNMMTQKWMMVMMIYLIKISAFVWIRLEWSRINRLKKGVPSFTGYWDPLANLRLHHDYWPLADCPLLCLLDLYIYTAGSGNPLYCAELLKQCSSVKNKAIGLIFFAELESCMHKVDVEAKKWQKSDENPPKSARKVPFFILWPEFPPFRPAF